MTLLEICDALEVVPSDDGARIAVLRRAKRARIVEWILCAAILALLVLWASVVGQIQMASLYVANKVVLNFLPRYPWWVVILKWVLKAAAVLAPLPIVLTRPPIGTAWMWIYDSYIACEDRRGLLKRLIKAYGHASETDSDATRNGESGNLITSVVDVP